MQKQTQLSEMPVAVLIITIVVMLGLLLGVLYYFAANVAELSPSVVIIPAKQELTITTDKAEYEQGEDIVWQPQNYKLGDLFLLRESCNDNFTNGPELEEYKNGFWKKLYWYNPMEKECFVAFLECVRLKNTFNGVIKTKYIYYENEETFLEKGIYRIKMTFGRTCEQGNQKMGELKNLFTVYSNEFTIKEKSAIDPRCGQKVKITGVCEGKLIDDIGYQFNSEIGKCIEKAVGGVGCRVETPFNTLEECQKVCEKQIDFYSCFQDSDCVKVNAGCCGCTAGGSATAINKNYKNSWRGNCEKEMPVMCPAVMSGDPSCFAEPKCIDSKCVLE